MTEAAGWQQQVATLTAERHRAEAAARLVKRLGSPGEVTRAEIVYGDGRAEALAVIDGLSVALEAGAGGDPTDLGTRMAQAVAARETLAGLARDIAARGPAEKGVLLDLADKALPGLVAAIGALWNRRGERDAALRATIAARLDGARWADFPDIAAG